MLLGITTVMGRMSLALVPSRRCVLGTATLRHCPQSSALAA